MFWVLLWDAFWFPLLSYHSAVDIVNCLYEYFLFQPLMLIAAVCSAIPSLHYLCAVSQSGRISASLHAGGV